MRSVVVAVLASFIGISSAVADLATIIVDIATKTVSPENPTVNIAANDSVLLRLVADGKNLPSSALVETFLAGPVPLEKASAGTAFAYSPAFPSAEGQSPLIVLKRCDERAKFEHRVALSEASGETPRCPFYILDSSRRAWTVFIDEGVLLVRVSASWEQDGKKHNEEHAFAVQVVERNYGLVWSAGFSFIGVRDKEYRLDPISGDDQNLALVANGDGQVPYQLAAFAHYPRLAKRGRSLSASFGLATTVPVNELTAMAGLTLSLRTLPLVNSGHLTFGVAYAPRKELISDYRGRATVPAGTAVASLTSSRYAWGPFIAVTFSFFGGEEQFKGVYSGKPSAEKK